VGGEDFGDVLDREYRTKAELSKRQILDKAVAQRQKSVGVVVVE